VALLALDQILTAVVNAVSLDIGRLFDQGGGKRRTVTARGDTITNFRYIDSGKSIRIYL
jgi:hypothetical protein